MRIYDPQPDTLDALRGTNIELMIDVPNDKLESLNDLSEARVWVQNNIRNYHDVKFRYIAVGNEVDPNSKILANRGFVKFTLPAMRNVHQAIVEAELADQIKVSTATYTGLLANSYPPSKGKFHANVEEFMKPIIEFLVQINSPMLANIYPYFAYRDNPVDVNRGYALFEPATPPPADNGRVYTNLFDAMFDAHYAAQESICGGNLDIVVSESGWPSEGHAFATPDNAKTYYQNLIKHVKSGRGTPARPGRSIETYLFAMFDENSKPGEETEKHFGLFTPVHKDHRHSSDTIIALLRHHHSSPHACILSVHWHDLPSPYLPSREHSRAEAVEKSFDSTSGSVEKSERFPLNQRLHPLSIPPPAHTGIAIPPPALSFLPFSFNSLINSLCCSLTDNHRTIAIPPGSVYTVVRVWRSIAVAVCTEYGPKKEKQIRKPKPPLSRVRFFLEKELMDWVTSGDCKQDLNWQLGLNGQATWDSWSDYMGFMGELFKEGMEWNGMTDSITVKKGKAIADAYNSPDEDFALQNLALQIVNRFLAKL
ncbi:hypothetical protein LXL04_033427 [Taraxacum kok-saghyz]